jgi:DNA-binding transcriptional LysR family regulator
MDVAQIRTFITIAQLGGFARAARQLHRSQPAISRRIHLLEQEIGSPLLERLRGSVQLTDVGRAFLPHAEAILAGVADAEQSVRAITRTGGDAVNLALVGTLLDTPLIETLRRFSIKTSAKLTLRTGTSWDVSQWVRRGEAGLGLRYFTEDTPSLCSQRIADETFHLVVGRDHPLARRPPRHVQTLAREQWIGFAVLRKQPEYFGNIVRNQLALAGLTDVEPMIIDSLAAQKRLVEAGLGIAMLPMSSIRDELRRRTLKLVRLSPLSTTIPIALVRRRHGYLSPATERLMDAVVATARRSARA